MDAAAAKEAFWTSVVEQMPMIVGAVVTLALAALGWATRKLGEAARDAAADVERAARSGPRMTPTEKMQAAVKKTRNTLGMSSSLLPAAVIRAKVEDVVQSAKAMERAKSDPQLLPGESGEHVINIPRNDPPFIPRPTGEFSGLDMSAIEGIHDANETGDDDA